METISKRLECFKECQSTLKEASKDDDGNYLSDQEIPVIKLDEYSEEYQQEREASEAIKMVDAVLEHNHQIFMFEFKNCNKIKSKMYNVLEKMYGSPIVIGDKLNLSIQELREICVFVLVYSYHKNKTLISEIGEYADTQYNEYVSVSGFQRIHDNLKKLAKPASVKIRNKEKFGLKKLEKYLYKEVIVIPELWLNEYLKEEGIIVD